MDHHDTGILPPDNHKAQAALVGEDYWQNYSNENATIAQSNQYLNQQYSIPCGANNSFQLPGVIIGTPNGLVNACGSNMDINSGFNSPANYNDSLSFVVPSFNAVDDNSSTPQRFTSQYSNDSRLQFVVPSDQQRISLSYEAALSQLHNALQTCEMKKAESVCHALRRFLKENASALTSEQLSSNVPVLIQALRRFKMSERVVIVLLATVQLLTSRTYNLSTYFVDAGLCEYYKSVLDLRSDAPLFQFVSIIHSVMLHVPSAAYFFSQPNNVLFFVKLLSHSNEKFLNIVVSSLDASFKCMDVKFLVEKTEFLPRIMNILRTQTYEKVLVCSVMLLKRIAAVGEAKALMIQFGMVHLFSYLLLNESRRVAVCSLKAIYALSDHACHLSNFDELIQLLIKFVCTQFHLKRQPCASDDRKAIEEKLVAITISILSNLTCNNKHNKELIAANTEFMGILCNAYSVFDSREVLAAVSSTLRHLLTKNEKNSEVLVRITESDGLSAIASVVKKSLIDKLRDSVHLKKNLFGILLLVASETQNLAKLHDLNVTTLTALTMAHAREEIKQLDSSSIRSDCGSGNEKSIKMYKANVEKLLDSCVSLLLFMASDTNSQSLMISSPVLMSHFSNLLIFSKQSTLFHVINIFYRFSKSAAGIQSIEKAFLETKLDQQSSVMQKKENIFIAHLSSLLCQFPNTPTFMALSSLLSNLKKSQLSRFIENVDQPISYIEVGSPDIRNLLIREFDGTIDSPPTTLSPSNSRVFDV